MNIYEKNPNFLRYKVPGLENSVHEIYAVRVLVVI